MIIMLQIYKTPIGESARAFFIEQINSLPYDDCIYILPSRLMIAEAKKISAIQTGSMDDLVHTLLPLIQQTYQSISAYARNVLLSKIISELQATKHLSYFQELALDSNFINNIANLLGEFALNYVDSDSLLQRLEDLEYQQDSTINLQTKKLRDLAKIYAVYQITLDNLQLTDVFAGYLHLNAALSNFQGTFPWKKIYISDFYSLAPVEQSIIKKLARYTDVHIALSYDHERATTFKSTNTLFELMSGLTTLPVIDIPPVNSSNLTNIAHCIFTNNTTKSTVDELRLYGLYNKNAELEFVAKDIKKKITQGTCMSEIIVCLRSMNVYNNLEETFQRSGVPCSLAEQLKVRQHFFFKMLMDFLQLTSYNFQKNDLRKFLFSSPLVFALEIPKADLEKIFLENKIESFAQLYEVLAKAKLHKCISIVEKIEEFLSIRPQQATIGEYMNYIKNFMQTFSIIEGLGNKHKQQNLDLLYLKKCLSVYKLLFEVLEEMAEVNTLLYGVEHKVKLATFINDLYTALGEKSITIHEGNQNAIRVLIASDMQGIKSQHVYIMGLNEGIFPQHYKDNWLFSNADANALQVFEGSRYEQANNEDAFFFTTALSAACSSITITYWENESNRKSKYLFELQKTIPTLQIQTNFAMLPMDINDIYSEYELLNFLLYHYRKNFSEMPHQVKEWLQTKIPLEILDNSNKTQLEYTQKIRNLLKSNYCFSVTQLEMYLQCPFKFMLKYLWKIKSWNILADDNTALTKGNFFHKIAEELMQKYLHEPLPDIEIAKKDLQSIFERMYEHTVVDNIQTWRLERMKNLQTLQTWLETEYSNFNNYIPYGTEWSFGKGTAPLQIGEFNIEGKIDRLDIQNNHLRISDYKLNTFPKSKDPLANTQSLQMPVYAFAAHKILNLNVNSCNYYSFQKHEYKVYMDIANGAPTFQGIEVFLEKTLQEIYENMYQGKFSPCANEYCKYCEYKYICRIAENNPDEEVSEDE